MKRYSIKKLISWKNKPNRKPLILQGARQTGKTWLLKDFGKQEYTNTAYLSFENNEGIQQIFKNSQEISRIISGIELETKVKIVPQETLIILDEIQECPNALNSLKYFCENAPQYHIAAAGSLLGVAMQHKGVSFPVGKNDFIDLLPMSFYEFLEAVGEERMPDVLRKRDFVMAAAFKDKYEHLLKEYLFVGGMPEAVKSFAEHKDFAEVSYIHESLLRAYEEDFSKHINNADIPKVRMIWDSIPPQLAKPNKKFVYSMIKSGARVKEFENAMDWLLRTGLAYSVSRANKPGLPLRAYEDRASFKLFMLDCGLMGAKAGLEAKSIIEGNRIFEEFRGALTEQYVMQELKNALNLPTAYWEGRNSEIDFIIQKSGQIIPIEVKSGINLKAKSLKAYIDKYSPEIAIRTSLADYKKTGVIYDIPLYAIGSLAEIIDGGGD